MLDPNTIKLNEALYRERLADAAAARKYQAMQPDESLLSRLRRMLNRQPTPVQCQPPTPTTPVRIHR